jgi:hypothetical protein
MTRPHLSHCWITLSAVLTLGWAQIFGSWMYD